MLQRNGNSLALTLFFPPAIKKHSKLLILYLVYSVQFHFIWSGGPKELMIESLRRSDLDHKVEKKTQTDTVRFDPDEL